MPWYQHRFNHPLALKTVFSIIPRLPKSAHPPIAALTAFFFFLALGKERKAILRNLCVVSPSNAVLRVWKAYRTFYAFCDLLVSYCYISKADWRQLDSMLLGPDHSREEIRRCLEMKKGVIVWTAHLGNYELASRLLEVHNTVVHVARVVDRNKPAEVMLRDMMQNDRLRVVDLNADILASVRLVHALRENEIVAIQGDRIHGDYVGEAGFFGRRTRFPLGPFLLSYISGAPILPGFVIRKRWLRYSVVVGKPIYVNRTSNREADLQAAMEKAVSFLQHAVGAYSDQWLNFFDFWAKQAPR